MGLNEEGKKREGTQLRPIKDFFSDGRHGRRGCREPIPGNAIEGDKCGGCGFPIKAEDGDRQPLTGDIEMPF